MNRVIILFYVSLFSINFINPTASSFSSKRIQKLFNKEVREVFGVENFKLQPHALIIPKSRFLEESLFQEIYSSDELKGYALLATAPSKTDSFEYLVLLDENMVILKAKVLVYREDYGGEIASKRWLSQFISKDMNSTLTYRSEVAAISGATISVKSMTASINQFLSALRSFETQTSTYASH